MQRKNLYLSVINSVTTFKKVIGPLAPSAPWKLSGNSGNTFTLLQRLGGPWKLKGLLVLHYVTTALMVQLISTNKSTCILLFKFLCYVDCVQMFCEDWWCETVPLADVNQAGSEPSCASLLVSTVITNQEVSDQYTVSLLIDHTTQWLCRLCSSFALATQPNISQYVLLLWLILVCMSYEYNCAQDIKIHRTAHKAATSFAAFFHLETYMWWSLFVVWLLQSYLLLDNNNYNSVQ
jgi:hypothetical protein